MEIPDNIRELFERQAAWQREQATLPWAEKLRRAAAVRDSLLRWRKPASPRAGDSSPRALDDSPEKPRAEE